MAIGRTRARLQSSGDLRFRIESAACDRCQDLCWTVEVWAFDLLGSDAKACLHYREHVSQQSRALVELGAWLIRNGRALQEAERAAYLLEHQQTLW